MLSEVRCWWPPQGHDWHKPPVNVVVNPFHKDGWCVALSVSEDEPFAVIKVECALCLHQSVERLKEQSLGGVIKRDISPPVSQDVSHNFATTRLSVESVTFLFCFFLRVTGDFTEGVWMNCDSKLNWNDTFQPRHHRSPLTKQYIWLIMEPHWSTLSPTVSHSEQKSRIFLAKVSGLILQILLHWSSNS